MKNSRIIISLVVITLLAACSNKVERNNYDANKLTVLIVEYSSGAPLNKLYVTLLDNEGSILDSNVSTGEGKVIFHNLEENEAYSLQIGLFENFKTGMYITEKEFTYSQTKQNLIVQTNAPNSEQALAVPSLLQHPELPNGCEITTLTAVLNYYGAATDKMEMTDQYLPKQPFKYSGNKKYGPDPNIAYGGYPGSLETGTYVFAEPIVNTANNFIKDRKLKLQAQNISGSTLEEITNYVDMGIPVIAWVTLDLSKPKIRGGWYIEETGEYHQMFTNLHTMVIIGIKNDKVEVMDPLKGYVTLDKIKFFESYVSLGEQAIVVY